MADPFPVWSRKEPAAIVESHDALLQMTCASDAIWITSPLAVSHELTIGQLRVLRPLDAPEPHRFELMAYHLEKRTLSPLAAKAISRVKGIVAAQASWGRPSR
jgi:DNA-binding transcriptional LysR family regulator